MNKLRLLIKLKKILPKEDVKPIFNSLCEYKDFDKIVDVAVRDGEIKVRKIDCSPRQYLKNAVIYYFDSKMPETVTTYTKLDNLAHKAKIDFDRVAIEAIMEIVSELEEEL